MTLVKQYRVQCEAYGPDAADRERVAVMEKMYRVESAGPQGVGEGRGSTERTASHGEGASHSRGGAGSSPPRGLARARVRTDASTESQVVIDGVPPGDADPDTAVEGCMYPQD